MNTIKAADLFCGAGGTSQGVIEACDDLGYKLELKCYNHWQTAVDTSRANHTNAETFCVELDSVNPRDYYREGELDLLWASPECTHHSIARGGKPINDQSRATAWCVVRWAEALRPNIILVENVKEFESWGAIGSNGRPLKTKKGEVFLSWVRCLEAMGYRVDWRVLCAADYGDPTTRERLFIYAVRGRRKIIWPEPTHIEKQLPDMFTQRVRWLTARDNVIDWTIPGVSIYGRKKPLAEKTIKRIMIGLEKFALKPFTIHMEHQGSVRSTDLPLPTITTAKGGAMALAEPYLIHFRGNCDAKTIEKPTPALTSGGGHLGLAQPYLVQVAHGNGADKNGDKRRVRSTDKPLPVVTGSRGEWALCEPFVIGQQSGATPRKVGEPLPTVAAAGAISLVEPFIVQTDHKGGNGSYVRDIKRPAPTVTGQPGIGICEPYLIHYYGASDVASVDKPLATVTTNDRFGIVMPVVEVDGERYLLDIRFRMLKPHELAAAQGFPKGYKFTGNTTQIVKQIGNAVPKNLSKALVRAALTQRA